MDTSEKCIYCGAPSDCRDYIINPKALHELPCCCGACYEQAMAFVRWDSKWRMRFYFGLTVMVVANLFLFGFTPDAWWRYLPMLGIAGLAALWPLVFARYERYQALGIRRTTVVVRVLAAGFALFAIVLMVTY